MWSPHPGRDGDAPFLSHDYSVTSRFFRRQLVVADAFRDLEYFDVEASDVLTVAVHARNGDRLPGRKYEKHMHLNLPDAYYIAALEALLAVARRPVRVVVFSSAVEPPTTSPRAAPRKPPRLLDHRGNDSALPAFLQARVPSHDVVLDNNAFADLAHFARSRVFLAARSQFSYAALALHRGLVIRPADWKAHAAFAPRFDPEHERRCHVRANDDGAVDRAKLAAALHDPRCSNANDLI